MEIAPGALIAGRYRVERKVGSGGMGEVWAGEHVAIGLRVAIKTLLPAAACDRQVVARFKREAYLLGRIRSDYVSKVIDFVTDERFGLVLVMEFVEGEPLSSVLEARKLGIEETIQLGIDVASALCDLHRAQVVHRDLKPENLLLEPHGDRKRATIVDFGLGRMVADREAGREEEMTGITHADMAVGTIAYMAPEQLLSSRDVTHVSDIYALGAILFRAASGHPIYGEIEDADYAKKKLFTEVPPLQLSRFDPVARGLAAIIARALKRRPEERFPSAQAMLDELRALEERAQIAALDLDGATEIAPLSAQLDLSQMPSLTSSEPPRRPDAPPPPMTDDEPTMNAMAIPKHAPVSAPRFPPSTPRPSFPEPSVQRPSLPSFPEAQARPSLPEVQAPRPSLPSFPEAHAPPSLRWPEEPTLPRNVALSAIAAALVGGLVLGFLAHRAIAERPPPPAPALATPGK